MKFQTIHYAMPTADLLSITRQLDASGSFERVEEGEQDGDAIVYYAKHPRTGAVAKKDVFRALRLGGGAKYDRYLVRAVEGLIDIKIG